MKKVLPLVAALFAETILHAAVERVDYADNASNVLRRQTEESNRGYAVSGSSFIALGLAPHVEFPALDCEVAGLRFNLLTGDHTDVYGLDFGVLGNFVKREIGGLQVAGLFNVVGESGGALQVAGVFNNCKGGFSGVQIGAVNVAEKCTGLQLGLVNRAYRMTGVQAGLLNLIDTSAVSIFPIVNFSF